MEALVTTTTLLVRHKISPLWKSTVHNVACFETMMDAKRLDTSAVVQVHMGAAKFVDFRSQHCIASEVALFCDICFRPCYDLVLTCNKPQMLRVKVSF